MEGEALGPRPEAHADGPSCPGGSTAAPPLAPASSSSPRKTPAAVSATLSARGSYGPGGRVPWAQPGSSWKVEPFHLERRAPLYVLEGQMELPHLSGARGPSLGFGIEPSWPVLALLVFSEVHLVPQDSAGVPHFVLP